MPETNRGGARVNAGHPAGAKSSGIALEVARRGLAAAHAGSAAKRERKGRGTPEPWVEVVASYYANGVGITEISRRMDKTPQTIRRWLTENPEAVTLAVQKLTNPHALIDPMVPEAAAAYHELMGGDTPANVRAAVAKDVLDRKLGKAVIRQEMQIREHVTIVFEDLRDDDVIDVESREV